MEITDLKELLDLATKGLAAVTTEMRVELKQVSKETDLFILTNLVLTSEDTNLDQDVLMKRFQDTIALKKQLLKEIKAAHILPEDALWVPENHKDCVAELKSIRKKDSANADAKALRTLIVKGLKGIAIFSLNAFAIGYEDEGISPFVERVLQRTLKFNLSVGLLFNLSMEVGGFGYRAMGLLDKAAVEVYGTPELTNVELGVRKNPGILVSGTNMAVLDAVLKQTEGTGVDVYTHGGLLSAHTYPNLKKYDHFAGNYGGSWQNQTSDFALFHGPVILTGSGVMAPTDRYADRLYTTGTAGLPGVRHLDDNAVGENDFSEVIEQAKTLNPPVELRKGEVIIGFAHDQMFKMLDLIKGGLKDHSIDRMVAFVGTDGPEPERTYYTAVAKGLPKNSVILSAGSVGYRFQGLGLGTVHGLPRHLNAGHNGDTYSICMTALKLQADLEKYDLNGVPITYNVSLHDEASTVSLLTLLYVGAKNVRIGPDIPDYMTENILGVFEKNFGIRKIGTPEEDIDDMFAEKKKVGEGQPIDTGMLIVDIIEKYPEAAQILMNCGMSCVTCGAALYESLSEACMVHGLDPEDVKEVLDHELGLVSDDD